MDSTRVTGLTLFVLIWQLLGSRGASFQGRGVAAWLVQLHEDEVLTPQSVANDENAIRQIGTNALPVLWEMAIRRDSSIKRQVLELLPAQFRFGIGCLLTTKVVSLREMVFEFLDRLRDRWFLF